MTAEKMDINLYTDRLSFLKFLAIIKSPLSIKKHGRHPEARC